MVTIRMHVHHGGLNATEQATAATVGEALALLHGTPLGAGYMPHPGTDSRAELAAGLERDGAAPVSFGWGDYMVASR